MHAVIRTYAGESAKELFDLLEQRKADVEREHPCEQQGQHRVGVRIFVPHDRGDPGAVVGPVGGCNHLGARRRGCPKPACALATQLCGVQRCGEAAGATLAERRSGQVGDLRHWVARQRLSSHDADRRPGGGFGR